MGHQQTDYCNKLLDKCQYYSYNNSLSNVWNRIYLIMVHCNIQLSTLKREDTKVSSHWKTLGMGHQQTDYCNKLLDKCQYYSYNNSLSNVWNRIYLIMVHCNIQLSTLKREDTKVSSHWKTLG